MEMATRLNSVKPRCVTDGRAVRKKNSFSHTFSASIYNVSKLWFSFFALSCEKTKVCPKIKQFTRELPYPVPRQLESHVISEGPSLLHSLWAEMWITRCFCRRGKDRLYCTTASAANPRAQGVATIGEQIFNSQHSTWMMVGQKDISTRCCSSSLTLSKKEQLF